MSLNFLVFYVPFGLPSIADDVNEVGVRRGWSREPHLLGSWGRVVWAVPRGVAGGVGRWPLFIPVWWRPWRGWVRRPIRAKFVSRAFRVVHISWGVQRAPRKLEHSLVKDWIFVLFVAFRVYNLPLTYILLICALKRQLFRRKNLLNIWGIYHIFRDYQHLLFHLRLSSVLSLNLFNLIVLLLLVWR